MHLWKTRPKAADKYKYKYKYSCAVVQHLNLSQEVTRIMHAFIMDWLRFSNTNTKTNINATTDIKTNRETNTNSVPAAIDGVSHLNLLSPDGARVIRTFFLEHDSQIL